MGERNPVSNAHAVVVLMTFPVDGDVTSFSTLLVESGCAACVNVGSPVESVFRWDGQLERVAEYQLFIKSHHDRLKDLQRLAVERHPYDTPEFLILQVSGGDRRYLDWIRAMTQRRSSNARSDADDQLSRRS